jgi:AraC-like DNA-binding protein
MKYKHFQPIPALMPYIDSFWVIEAAARSGDSPRARMPADSRATLLLSFSGESRMTVDRGTMHHVGSGATLLGVHSQSYLLEHEGDTNLIAAQFRPGGLAAFVRCGVGELAAQAVPLDLLWGRPGNDLSERIFELDDTSQKLAVYQDMLLKCFAEVPQQARILNSLNLIENAQGNPSVEWLAEQANLSQKQFERQFERVVGMMPKHYMRLARFQKLVRWLRQADRPANWTAIAARFAYYDHAHLAKDFRAFAGTTPSEFAATTAGVVEVAYGSAEALEEV